MKSSNKLSLKTLTKSSAWGLQEADVFHLWQIAARDADLKDNRSHYLSVLRSAFEVEELTIDTPEVVQKYEDRGFKVAPVRMDENVQVKLAVKKKPIVRITDLTYENIRHISAAKLIEVLAGNFGGGWESLPQSVQDIIESGFDISTTTLPTSRLKRPGGMYQKKVEDGFEVLEVPKGGWTEAIFAKAKPAVERVRMRFEPEDSLLDKGGDDMPEDDNEDEELPEAKGFDSDDDDDDYFDEDKLTEESYRTTYEASTEELEKMAREGVSDDGDDY